MLVIVGSRWLESFSLVDASVKDHVLIELEVALEQGVPLIPVLVGATPMPSGNTLPPSIAQVSFRNAFALDLGPEFDIDFNRLLSHLDALRMGQGQGHRHRATCNPHSLGIHGKRAAPDYWLGGRVLEAYPNSAC